MRYLVDTSIFVAAMARADREVRRRFNIHGSEIGVSAIVLHELYFGAFWSERVAHNLGEVEKLGFPLVAFDLDDARAAAEIRARLKREGTPIGPYDVLIAGQALARGLTVVTANIGEYARVEGLRVENWS